MSPHKRVSVAHPAFHLHVFFLGNLLGAPIATAIINAQGGKYLGAILFAGAAPVIAAFFILMVRFQYTKKVFAIV